MRRWPTIWLAKVVSSETTTWYAVPVLLVITHKEFQQLMSALDNLNANLSKLSTDIDALIAKQTPSGVPEADVQAVADAVANLDAKVTAALNPVS